jgi:hypothetical protein
MSFFRKKSLDTILSTFDRVAADLARHVEAKALEQFELEGVRDEVTHAIEEVKVEVDRAHRVLSKVSEFVA